MIGIDREQFDNLVRTSWHDGADFVYRQVIEQCDTILAASGTGADSLTAQAVRDWCETMRLEMGYHRDQM